MRCDDRLAKIVNGRDLAHQDQSVPAQRRVIGCSDGRERGHRRHCTADLGIHFPGSAGPLSPGDRGWLMASGRCSGGMEFSGPR